MYRYDVSLSRLRWFAQRIQGCAMISRAVLLGWLVCTALSGLMPQVFTRRTVLVRAGESVSVHAAGVATTVTRAPPKIFDPRKVTAFPFDFQWKISKMTKKSRAGTAGSRSLPIEACIENSFSDDMIRFA